MKTSVLELMVFFGTRVPGVCFDPHHEKSGFFHIRTQRRRSADLLVVTAQIINAFVPLTGKGTISFLPKLKAFFSFMPFRVGQGRKPWRPVFSRRFSFDPSFITILAAFPHVVLILLLVYSHFHFDAIMRKLNRCLWYLSKRFSFRQIITK